MFDKSKIKSLSIIFGILLVFTLVVVLVDSKKENRSFKSILVEIDTEKADEISFYRKGEVKNTIQLKRTESDWRVSLQGREAKADKAMVNNLFELLNNLKTKRLAARSKEKWELYEVTDSLGIRVMVNEADERVLDLIIGEFSFQQSQNPYNQQPVMSTYVRLADEDEVYVVDGFLSMSFGDDFNSFRDKSFIDAGREQISQVQFNYPDSAFVLARQQAQWTVGGIMADSAKVADFMGSIAGLKQREFVDQLEISALGDPVFSISVRADNMPTAEIKAFPADSLHGFYVTSSLNPNAVFSANKGNLPDKLFKSKSDFIAE